VPQLCHGRRRMNPSTPVPRCQFISQDGRGDACWTFQVVTEVLFVREGKATGCQRDETPTGEVRRAGGVGFRGPQQDILRSSPRSNPHCLKPPIPGCFGRGKASRRRGTQLRRPLWVRE
jgi:hypothetical protein